MELSGFRSHETIAGWLCSEDLDAAEACMLRDEMAGDARLRDCHVFCARDPLCSQVWGRAMSMDECEELTGKWRSDPSSMPVVLERIYVVPKGDVVSILRYFSVGACHDRGMKFHGDLAERLGRIDAFIPLRIAAVSESRVVMGFARGISRAESVMVQRRLMEGCESPLSVGLEGYLLNWDGDEENVPVAGEVFREQGISLWWD